MENSEKKEKEYWHKSYIKTIPTINIIKKEIHTATQWIIKSIESGKKIVIKHHKDIDGLVGGYVLEKSIKHHAKYMNSFINLSRLFYSSPHYTYAESIKDQIFLSENDLLILIDFASSKESLEGIKRIAYKGVKVIIIDHHPLEYSGNALHEGVLLVNPYIYGREINVPAAIISISISENISKIKNKYLLGLISCYGDKFYDEDYFKYMQEKIKTNIKEIEKYAKVIDYEIFNTYQDYGIIDFVLSDKNRKFVNKKYNEIKKREEEMIKICLQHLIKEKNIFVISYDKIIISYPPPGRLTGIIFEYLKEKYTKVVVVGKYNNYLIFRSNIKEIVFSSFLNKLKKILPEGSIDGGGHEEAGSIKLAKGIEINNKTLLKILTEEGEKGENKK